MAKKSKKSDVLFEMRNMTSHVILRLRQDGDFDKFLTCAPFIVEVSDLSARTIQGFGFSSCDDAENFIFEHYAYIFIPYSRWTTEGHHLFVY